MPVHYAKDWVMGGSLGYVNTGRLANFQPLKLHIPSFGDTLTVFLRVVILVPSDVLAREKTRVPSGGHYSVTISMKIHLKPLSTLPP
ncbi:hypothetical protein AAF712_005404 [Marasmius tenuissimus]|uniref:Uncharacterized protein n=1 Tax=Marasmius tenuissimus TaxID=585030 RepID=A0ABR3A3X2_9AGAR